jgi:hypothetical protein
VLVAPQIFVDNTPHYPRYGYVILFGDHVQATIVSGRSAKGESGAELVIHHPSQTY